jgi:hypothetical protein
MTTFIGKLLGRSFLSGSLILALFALCHAGDRPGFQGWEEGSDYNGHYNYRERDSLKGKIVKFVEVTPLPGMDDGTAFLLDEGGEKILVHLCPVAYRAAKETGILTNVKTKVSGCWAVIGGQDVFIAAKVKQGENFAFKVRLTKDGRPFWSLSEEELAKESAAD